MLEITYPTLGYKGREKYTLQRLPDAFCTTIVYTDCKGTCRYRYVTSYYVAGNKWVADFLPVAETNSRDRPLIVHGFAKKLQGKAYFHKKKNRSLNRKPKKLVISRNGEGEREESVAPSSCMPSKKWH